MPCGPFLVGLLLDLAGQCSARREQLRNKLSSRRQDLSRQDAQLFQTIRPLGDVSHPVGGQPFAVHHATAGLEVLKVLGLVESRDFFDKRNEILAAPHDGERTFGTLERGCQRRSFRGSPRHAVLDHQQVHVLLAKFPTQRDGLIGTDANHVDQHDVLDTLEPFRNLADQ